MYKKLINISLTLALSLLQVFSINVFANNDFETNSQYYDKLCKGDNLNENDKAMCKLYGDYLKNIQDELQNDLEQNELDRKKIANNIEQEVKKIKEYEKQIEILQIENETLSSEIEVLKTKIKEKQAEIKIKEKQVIQLQNKVKKRVIESQKTMRVNQNIDFIMGAKSFADLIKRTTGLNATINYDEQTRIDLADTIEYLNEIKAALLIDKDTLDNKLIQLQDKQNKLEKLKNDSLMIKEEYMKKEAEIEAKGNQIAGNIEDIKNKLDQNFESIDDIESSTAFTKPTTAGRITANTWAYNNGGVHLGLDIAAPSGTPIKAAGNGVILKSVDGCGVGYIGSDCGENQGGTYGGGNQVYLLTQVNNILYAIKYIHLLKGSPIDVATVVKAGDTIGKIGSSGNSTGSHLHVEVFKLGTMTPNEYIDSWLKNPLLHFGAKSSKAGLNNLCSIKGPPCREKPEVIFGY